MSRFALTHGTVLDGPGGVVPDGTVLIEDGRITALGAAVPVPDGVPEVDVRGKAVLPGLVDAHIHLAIWAQNLLWNPDRTVPYLVARTVANFQRVLDSGCTTARDCGGLDAGLRDAVAERLIPGPRLLTAVTIVSPTDGLVDPVTAQGIVAPRLASIPAPAADGCDQVRAKVREVIRAGADFVKIATSGGVSSPRVHPRRQLFTAAEVRAAVDEAHTAGVRVACHAIGGTGLSVAVAAGVDSVEHGALLTDPVIEQMAAQGTWYVPTLAVYRWHETLGDPSRQQRAREFHDAHRDSLRRALAAGVPVAAGSDAGGYTLDFSLELELLVEAGLSPLAALRAGTIDAARCAGVDAETGSLAPGKAADLLVVDGDPSRDITALRDPARIEAVFRDGRLLGGARRAHYELAVGS